jgi:hypothetical protein
MIPFPLRLRAMISGTMAGGSLNLAVARPDAKYLTLRGQ